MATHKFNKDYSPRYPFRPEFGIGDPENLKYLNSLTKWLMSKIILNAKPYHEKHNGVSDNGKEGKKITITFEQMKQKIIDTNGVSPDGIEIYFGSPTLMNSPSRAIELGLMSAEENSRKPSVDRIVSKLKEYSNENIQIVTKGFNLGKGADDSYSTITQNVKVKVKNGIELILDNCSPQFLAAYTQSLAI